MSVWIPQFRKTLSNLLYKNSIKPSSSDFVLYKIVDSYIKADKEYFKIQCICTKAILDLTIQGIVYDLAILHGLHPLQASFIGIEYAKILKKDFVSSKLQDSSKNAPSQPSISRYGKNNLLYQNRSGFLGFEDIYSGQQHLMDPRDIVLSQELIEDFDSSQAFYIGILAGFKFIHSTREGHTSNWRKNNSYLRLVK